MTKKLSIIIVLLLTFSASQGQNYWFGFVTSTGDTINKNDSLGYWQGLHVEMRSWGCNVLNDTCEYQIGYFKNGQPIGNWTDYKKDKSFSIGQYNSGIEVTSDGKGGRIEKHQGIYAKIGVWQYFDKDSNLVKTERYDRSFNHKGWTDKTYLKDSTSNFILVEYQYMNNKDSKSSFKRMIHNYYYDNGKPSTFNKRNFWTNGYTSFYLNGHVKEKYKCRKLLGFNHSVYKKYSDRGELIDKTKGKCSYSSNCL